MSCNKKLVGDTWPAYNLQVAHANEHCELRLFTSIVYNKATEKIRTAVMS